MYCPLLFKVARSFCPRASTCASPPGPFSRPSEVTVGVPVKMATSDPGCHDALADLVRYVLAIR